jgi:cytochrome c peroxidase
LKALEAQALVPIRNEHPIELGFAGREDELVRRLGVHGEYRGRFAAAFPHDAEPVTLANLARAISAFERTLISGSSPYDRLLFGDDSTALSDSAKRGLGLFVSERLSCAKYHGGRDFTTPLDGIEFRRNGLTRPGGDSGAPDLGLASRTGDGRDEGRFRVPTLRNVAVTAPYMHDGSIATLSEVIDAYASGGCDPERSEIHPFAITPSDKADLLAFLESLTDEAFLHDPVLGDPAADSDPSRSRARPEFDSYQPER